MRIGIFGGTFDPPHIGHINACKAFLEQVELDVLYVMPVYQPPHKNIFSGTNVDSRLEMAKIAFSSLSSKVVVSDLEIKREVRSYTAETIAQLKSEIDDAEIYFLCGTDMILTMDLWYKPEYIFKNATIVYVRRENDVEITEQIANKCLHYKSKFDAKIISITANAIEASSTEIREAIVNSNGEIPFVTNDIYKYIIENKLYEKKQNEI